jgi:hypothetical protein
MLLPDVSLQTVLTDGQIADVARLHSFVRAN